MADISRDLMMSALMCASEEGNLGGLEELAAAANLDVNVANELGETAVHVAAGSCQLEVLRFLQFKGGRLDVVDKHGDSALYWAARQGHLPVVQYLCDEGVQVDRQNKCKETALHVAVRYSQMMVIQYLCSVEADVNLQDEHGETPLHVASWHGFPMALDILCRKEPVLTLQNKDEETALHCAAARGHLECVQTLLDTGTNLDIQDKNGQTALHLALRRQHVDIALMLLSKGCKLDVQDRHGDTPLHLACRESLLTVVQTLCSLGCQLDILNTSSMSPLHVAAKEGHTEIARCLCLSGCNIGIKNKDGLTPEITALAQGQTQLGELLGKLKSDHQRETYIEQLCPTGTPLKRIKLKLFGHSGVGKSRLLQALQTGVLGTIFSGFRRWSETGSAKEDVVENGVPSKRKNPVDNEPAHSGYTRGIEVQNVNISGSGEFSAWEFSGYEPYHQVYDHFVGNADCVHVILFRATDSTEVQFQQVLYWMNFLKGRVMPSDPIGYGGALSRPLRLVLAATHGDQVSPPLEKNPVGEWISSEGEALLKTFRHRFGADFEIHDSLILVDGLQPNCPGMKALKAYLGQTRSDIIQHLPRQTGFLEASIAYLNNLRKQLSVFPVVTWLKFVQMIRTDVNPLAGEIHCRQLIQQLQLMGEVVYLKGDAQDLDYVVLSTEWLCSGVIGTILSCDFLQRCRPTGCYLPDDFHLLFPDVPECLDLLQILDALQLCTQCEADGDLEYEFPAFIFLDSPPGIWNNSGSGCVYGGMRVQAEHGMEQSFTGLFPRLQVQLRRSMQEFQDPVDADLCQWKACSKMSSGQMEGLIKLRREKQESVEILVRGPADLAASCFYFLEDLAQLTEQTVTEVAPGMPLERHFLSPKDLEEHSRSPAVYTPEAVMQMQQKEAISLKNNKEGEELFTDVVCFGAREVAMVLTLGIDLPVAQLPLVSRRELACLLDPPDSMGRDWSILAVRLGLTDQLPDVDSTGPSLSRTDQLLAEWALQDPQKSTVGHLCEVLNELGRKDAVSVLYKTVPLYMFAPTEEGTPSLTVADGGDSGLASASQSHSTSATSQRSSSTLS